MSAAVVVSDGALRMRRAGNAPADVLAERATLEDRVNPAGVSGEPQGRGHGFQPVHRWIPALAPLKVRYAAFTARVSSFANVEVESTLVTMAP